MLRKLFFALLLSVLSIFIFFACKKDPSCESCIENKPPIANAGKDTLITLPLDSIQLDGSLSQDTDGRIIEFSWRGLGSAAFIPIINKQTANPTIKNLTLGVYQFQLTVTDNNGALSSDNVSVFVSPASSSNRPPVANAGFDRTITLPTNSVLLNGDASTDPDNNIFSYTWTKISGPAPVYLLHNNLVLCQATGLVQGIYEFELRVTDMEGLFTNDTLMITVNPPLPALAPVASAGLDKIITLPVNSILLDGTGSFDPNNDPITFNWSKISGPPSGIISNSTAIQTQVTALTEGIYQFKLTVTDNGNLSASDTVKITVRPPTPPTEVIFDGLVWSYWHDQNDPQGIFDDIYLAIYDTTNILSYTPISVFVQLDSVGTWVQANPIVANTNCTPPYIFNISPTASPNTMVLFILSCPLNFNLIGTGASVKIIY